jgi:hypothetical protein
LAAGAAGRGKTIPNSSNLLATTFMAALSSAGGAL